MTFDKKGPQNTEQCLALALEAAKERGVRHIVVASSAGDTAMLLKEHAAGYNIVCVALAYGTRTPGETAMSDAARAELEQAGVRVVFATHVLSGAERGLSRRYKGIYPVEIMADTLRMFGRGVKVGVECAVMAVDAGLVPYGADVLAIGGSGRGGGQRYHPAPRARQQHSGNPDPRNYLQALGSLTAHPPVHPAQGPRSGRNGTANRPCRFSFGRRDKAVGGQNKKIFQPCNKGPSPRIYRAE